MPVRRVSGGANALAGGGNDHVSVAEITCSLPAMICGGIVRREIANSTLPGLWRLMPTAQACHVRRKPWRLQYGWIERPGVCSNTDAYWHERLCASHNDKWRHAADREMERRQRLNPRQTSGIVNGGSLILNLWKRQTDSMVISGTGCID